MESGSANEVGPFGVGVKVRDISFSDVPVVSVGCVEIPDVESRRSPIIRITFITECRRRLEVDLRVSCAMKGRDDCGSSYGEGT